MQAGSSSSAEGGDNDARQTDRQRLRPPVLVAGAGRAGAVLPDRLSRRGIPKPGTPGCSSRSARPRSPSSRACRRPKASRYPRQHNTFYYLSGIETPGAYLLLDGRTQKVTIYLPARNPRLEAAEGRVLSAEDADLVKRISGVDEVKPLAADGRTRTGRSSRRRAGRGAGGSGAAQPPAAIFAEFSPAENQGQSRGELVAAETSRVNDPGTAPASRQRRFVELLRARQPRAEVRNLNPILDEMRSIKSPREIALVRRASQIAGLGLMEAMRSTEPGVTEYQLDAAARYVFLVNDARLEGYRSITASGTENINNMHYFRNTSTLKDGDLVLMDYAPGLPLLRQRHRPRVAGQRQVHRAGSASCCSSCSSSTRPCCRASGPA